jgi:hypothetical protein
VQATDAESISAAPAAPVRWQYGAPGIVCVPHTAAPATTLRLLPFARWDSTDATGTRYQVTPATLAQARAQGYSIDSCWQLLEQQAGSPPAGWRTELPTPPAPLRLVHTAVLLVDAPALLDRAARARSVRRYLQQRVAPGIALIRPEHIAPLRRALERQNLSCAAPEAPPAAATAGTSAELSAGERAALVVACAHYRQHAPATAPLLPHAGLEARLRAGLTLRLNAAVDAALTELRQPPEPATAPPTPAQLEQTIDALREALHRQRPVELTYDTAGHGELNTRTVRPLALEQRDTSWYLRAYCSARQAERTFRLDRIVAIGSAS